MSQAQDAVLPFAIRGQYIKDFSFENPNPLKFLSEEFNKQPTISVDIQAKAGPVGDKVFEVVLDIQVDAKQDKEQVFLAELSYAGIVILGNIPPEHIEPLLMIHAPSLFFPFARNIISDAIRDGGFPSLMLSPVDFAYLYQQQKESEGQKANGHAIV